MYAIALDLDTEVLKNSYGSPSWNNASLDIRKTLTTLGFDWQQGSVYFGNPEVVNAVTCVLAVGELTRQYSSR
jgi:virulence-associated protein VapD